MFSDKTLVTLFMFLLDVFAPCLYASISREWFFHLFLTISATNIWYFCGIVIFLRKRNSQKLNHKFCDYGRQLFGETIRGIRGKESREENGKEKETFCQVLYQTREKDKQRRRIKRSLGQKKTTKEPAKSRRLFCCCVIVFLVLDLSPRTRP